MADPLILQPVPGAAAFAGRDADADWSAGAQIISAARCLSGDAEFWVDYRDDLSKLDAPPFSTAGGTLSDLLPDAARAGDLLRLRTAADDPDRLRAAAAEALSVSWRDAQRGSPAAAAAAILVGLRHPSEVIRVMSAASLVRFAPEFQIPGELDIDLTDVLVAGCSNENETIAIAAADALAVREPEHPMLRLMIGDARIGDTDEDEDDHHTSVMLHGTWARWPRGRGDPLWWEPNGEFNNFIWAESGTSPDLYQEPDYPRWAGSHRRRAQRQGSADLRTWSDQHGIRRLCDVYAHSHGGNVAYAAGQAGLEMTLLILMSVPRLHGDFPEQFIGRAISLRSHLDLVLILDRSPWHHPLPVVELGLSSWFSHSKTHDPAFWRANRLPNDIAHERRLSRLPPL